MAEAWERVGPGVLADEGELRARLARRRSASYGRPPREFCVAIRADDTRITPVRTGIVPAEAVESGRRELHRVKVDSGLLQSLCVPVEIPPPGLDAHKAAAMMGVNRVKIYRMIKDGRLIARYIRGLGGKPWSKPIPIVHTRGAIDPCAGRSSMLGPDRIWDELWRELVVHIPEGLEFELRREPRFSVLRGVRMFLGWRWLCPGCGGLKRKVFLPLDLPDFAALHKVRIPEDEQALALGRPWTLACQECHGILRTSGVDDRALNDLWSLAILHLSGGLLFGNEVERPRWLQVGAATARKYRERDPEHEKNEADRLRRERFTRAFDSGPLYINGKLNPVFYED